MFFKFINKCQKKILRYAFFTYICSVRAGVLILDKLCNNFQKLRCSSICGHTRHQISKNQSSQNCFQQDRVCTVRDNQGEKENLRKVRENQGKTELFSWSGEICVFQIDFVAFKSGAEASGWNLKMLLKLCFHLLKDTLARRDDFISITEWTKFPLQFCATRFLELFIF